MKYQDLLGVDPKVRFETQCVLGTRVLVEQVLELGQEGIPFSENVEHYYPDLQIDDVKACVVHATEQVCAEENLIGTERCVSWSIRTLLRLQKRECPGLMPEDTRPRLALPCAEIKTLALRSSRMPLCRGTLIFSV